MYTNAARATTSSIVEESFPMFFGEWVKHRRNELGLSQAELSSRACCSVFALRKIESGERKPSRQLSGFLAMALNIPPEGQTIFIKVARGELNTEKLAKLDHAPGQPAAPALAQFNLPRALTPFIGREAELGALSQLLHNPHSRLITITGPGGIGKTRLAVEAAQKSTNSFPDGSWFVPLVSLNSPGLIIQAIASSVGFQIQDPTNPQAQLIRFLSGKRALVVLDNAEHLLEGAGTLAVILDQCPQVKLLVTSRERLNLLSEWVFEIQGLTVPPNDQAEHFEAYSAVDLFLQSARRLEASFNLKKDERQWVLKICQIMEGMPLGIELSAAWVGVLSCEEIAREIERNLDFLSVSLRDVPERHRSLRATLEHSWKLLGEEEKLILSRLSVFRGKFRREAAEEICGANLTILSSLRNKTLLYRTDQGFYSLHEAIRQYVAHKLGDYPVESETVKDKHSAYFVQSLAKWEKAIQSSRQLEIFTEMAQLTDDLAQAWQHLITHCRPMPGKNNQFCADLIHSALFSLSLFLEMRCRSQEGVELFTKSVDYLKSVRGEFEGTEDKDRFNSVLGHITAYLGIHQYYMLQYARAFTYLGDAIRLLEESNSRVEKAQAQVMLGALQRTCGNIQESEKLLEQAQVVFRETGQRWWYALSTIHLAATYLAQEKLPQSEELFQMAFQLVEPGDFRLEIPLRTNYAYLLYLQEDFPKAEQCLEENLQLSHEYGDNVFTAQILFDLGRVALATNRIEQAEEYIHKSINIQREIGILYDLAINRIYLGKCFAARQDRTAARDQFQQVVKMGMEYNKRHFVYWGLANIARIYLDEGQPEKALEISLAIKQFPVEVHRIQVEIDRISEDAQALFSKDQLESAMIEVNGRVSADHGFSGVLASILDRELS